MKRRIAETGHKTRLAAVFLATALVSGSPAVANQTTTPLLNEDDTLQLVVSLDEQKLAFYRGSALIKEAPISSGKRGHTTPRGIFSILEKRRTHFSNLYDDAPMPFMQRLTWSGIALHQGRLPGYPASHGCIRLTRNTAANLFKSTSRGMHVVITRERQRPMTIEHDQLPLAQEVISARKARLASTTSLSTTPLRTTAIANDGRFVTVPLRTDAADVGVQLASLNQLTDKPSTVKSEKPVRVLITRRTGRERLRDIQHMLTMVGYEPGPLDGLMGRRTRAAIEDFQARTGLHVDGEPTAALEEALYKAFGKTDRQTGHIYVRQGFKPIFDAPIGLSGDAPLGTHLFTAQSFDGQSLDVRWTALTAEAAEGMTARSALDRVSLPEDVRSRLEAMLTPGSSIIVSDHGISRETGKGTDFVVLTR